MSGHLICQYFLPPVWGDPTCPDLLLVMLGEPICRDLLLVMLGHHSCWDLLLAILGHHFCRDLYVFRRIIQVHKSLGARGSCKDSLHSPCIPPNRLISQPRIFSRFLRSHPVPLVSSISSAPPAIPRPSPTCSSYPH